MARIIGDLNTNGNTKEIDIPEDQNGGGSVQILEWSGGTPTGTVVIEQSNERTVAGADVWSALPTAVAVSALGVIATFEVIGANKIRMRRSAGDATALRAVLSFNRP